MKEKLTLEYLAPYLPYLLQLQWYYEKTIDMSIANIEKVIEFSLYENILYKPLLHPLSKLTKEIEHNGEKFVPLDWFPKNGFRNDILPEWWFDCNACASDMDSIMYTYVRKLFEWHFDVFGLIEKGLAIEKQ